MAEKIKEIVHTGSLKQLEALKQKVPGELGELLTLSGLGPKRVHVLHEELGIEDREGLAAAAREGRIRELEGLGPKTEQKILDELEKRRGERTTAAGRRGGVAETLLDYLRAVDGVKTVVIAGSYRRCKATVGDLDILVHLQTQLAGHGPFRRV
jgi:DNA polymerase (family X)